jgi:UDP-glucose 4-epimerase
MANSSVLVTGGAGFIGAHVAKKLVEKGFEVTVLDDLSGGYLENVPAGARFVKGSICDQQLVENLFKTEKFKYVFHLAAYAAEGLSHFIRKFNYENNLLGSVNLINESVKHEVERFVFTSSIAVYGFLQPPLLETTLPVPADPYGVAKLAVEQDLKAAREMFKLPFTIFRPHNVYGEFQNIGDRYRNVVGIFMNQILRGEPLTIFGDGKQTRAFSYIEDVALPIVDCIQVNSTVGEIFNVGADTPFSVNELAEAVMSTMGKKAPIKYLEKRHEAEHSYSDHGKVRKFFPNLPKPTGLNEGLARMSAWVQKTGSRKSKIFANVEILKNMPPAWAAEFTEKK